MKKNIFIILFLNTFMFTNVFAEQVCVEYKDNKSIFNVFQKKECKKKVDLKYAKCDTWTVAVPYWSERECKQYKERTVCMAYSKVEGRSRCSKVIPQKDYEELPPEDILPVFEDDPVKMVNLREYIIENKNRNPEQLGGYSSLRDKLESEMDNGAIAMPDANPVCCSSGICRFSDEALSCNLAEGTIFDNAGEENSDLGDILSIISIQSGSSRGEYFKGYSDVKQCESCYKRIFNTRNTKSYDEVKESLINKIKNSRAKDELNNLILNASILKNYYDLHKDKLQENEKESSSATDVLSSYKFPSVGFTGDKLDLPTVGPSSPTIYSMTEKGKNNFFQCLPFERLEVEAGSIGKECSKKLYRVLRDYGRNSKFGKNYLDLKLEGPSLNLAEKDTLGGLYNQNLRKAIEKESQDVRLELSEEDLSSDLNDFYTHLPFHLIRHNTILKKKCEEINKSRLNNDLFHYHSKLFSLSLISFREGREELDGSEYSKMKALMITDPNLGIHFNNAIVYCDVLNEYEDDLESISKIDFKVKIQKSGLLSFDKEGEVRKEAEELADSLCIQQANKILGELCYGDQDSNVIQDNLKNIKPDELRLTSSEKLILAEESCKKRVIKKQAIQEAESGLNLDSGGLASMQAQAMSPKDKEISDMREFNKASSEIVAGESVDKYSRVNRNKEVTEEVKEVLDQALGKDQKARNTQSLSAITDGEKNEILNTDTESKSTPLKVQPVTSEPVVSERLTPHIEGNNEIPSNEGELIESEFTRMYSDMIENSNKLVGENPIGKGKSVQEMMDSGEIEKPNPSDLQNVMAQDSALGEQFVDVSGKLTGNLKDGVDAVDELEDYLVNNGNIEGSFKDDMDPSEKEKLLKEIEDLKAAAVMSAIEKKHSEKVQTMESRIADLESELAGFKKIQAAGVSTNNRSNESNRAPSNLGVNGSRTAGVGVGFSKDNGSGGGGSDYNAGNGLSPELKGLSPEERARYLNQIKKIPKSVIENPEQFSISLTYDKKQSRALLVIPKAGLTTEGEYALYPDQIKVDNIENPTVVILGDIKRAIPISQLSEESRKAVFSLVKLQTKNKIIEKQDLVSQELAIARDILESEKQIADRYSVFKNCLKNPTDKVCK